MRGPLFLLALLFAVAACSPPASETETSSEVSSDESTSAERPNFLIVIADDLGWSDLGAFGGEINTPNLDSIAARGRLLTDFYVAPTCSPTRSMLMTGVSNHAAGIGAMHHMAAPNQTTINYAGQLHDGVVTFTEVLQASGYETLMSGKWHLGVDPEQRPEARGFDRSYTLLQGGASHFADRQSLNPVEIPEYLEDGEPVELPEDFYSTITFTDKMVEYLSERDADKPFFAYLTYTAPHDPLQVPDSWLDTYDGAYDAGPAAIRQARAEAVQSKGFFPEDADLWQLPNFPPSLPLHMIPWEQRSEAQREAETRPMEIYASMIELMDQQFGRVLEQLEADGSLDNTYIIFFSDNGASAAAPLLYPGNTKEWLAENWGAGPDAAGQARSFTVMGREWSNVSSTPWRLNKGMVAEGGIRSPMMVSGPDIPAQSVSNSISHVMDIAPTIYALADIDISDNPLYADKLAPVGLSQVMTWQTGEPSARTFFATELFGGMAVRDGMWKASNIRRPQGSGEWELFDLETDPSETKNLAAEQPDILAGLLAKYDAFAEENGVIAPNPPPTASLRQTYPGPCDEACEQAFVDFQAQAGDKGPPPAPKD